MEPKNQEKPGNDKPRIKPNKKIIKTERPGKPRK